MMAFIIANVRVRLLDRTVQTLMQLEIDQFNQFLYSPLLPLPLLCWWDSLHYKVRVPVPADGYLISSLVFHPAVSRHCSHKKSLACWVPQLSLPIVFCQVWAGLQHWITKPRYSQIPSTPQRVRPGVPKEENSWKVLPHSIGNEHCLWREEGADGTP